MNERIQELAEQAMGTRKHVPPVWQFFDHELEHFARLIVEELLALAQDEQALHLSSQHNHQAAAISDLRKRIQSHFTDRLQS